MEERINIAEILKNKPRGTILYSPICGECKLSYIESEKSEPQIGIESDAFGAFYFWDDGKAYVEGECLLYPSDKMRDWAKIAWKKGDVLVNKDRDAHIVFEKFTNETYTAFTGKYYYLKNSEIGYHYAEVFNAITEHFTLEAENAAQTYIKTIEEKLGGKLNRDTLEIDKQPEFKDGDIVVSNSGSIVLVKEIKCGERVYYHACMINGNVYIKGTEDEYYGIVSDIDRLAADTEKLQFFDALAKKGKRWDVGKKQIVDLKPKVELKPFDKVLVRDAADDAWHIDLFERMQNSRVYPYMCLNRVWNFCIPYNENTKHLLGTTDEWEGGKE